METTKKVLVIAGFVIWILTTIILIWRETTTAQVMADFNGYQRCVAEVQAQMAKAQEAQTNPSTDVAK